jgi:hypothetical protein
MTIRKRVSFLGFIVGSIVDIVGSNVWGIIITFYVIFSYNLLKTPPAQMSSSVMHIFKTDPLVFSANLVVGGLFSILGGYIGALIAKHDELLNGALSSILCVCFGFYAIATGSYTTTLILAILSLFIDPLLSMFGGYLRLLQVSRKRRAPLAYKNV